MAGAAAIPALSLPAIAEANPDAELIALGEKLKHAVAAWHVHAEAGPSEAEDRYQRLKPPDPEVTQFPELPDELKKLFPDITMGQLEAVKKVAPDHPIVAFYDNYEMHPSWRAWSNECARLSEECGIAEIEIDGNELFDTYMEILDQILEIPARTLAGMAVKVEAAHITGLVEATDLAGAFGGVWESLCNDIEAKAGTTQA
jgi:hypothetical protein